MDKYGEQLKQEVLSENFMGRLCVFYRNFFHKPSFPIPTNHFIVLVILQNESILNIAMICRLLSMSKQQMTPIISRLSREGYVAKQASTTDHRYMTISITQNGIKFLEEYAERIRVRLRNRMPRRTG